MASITERLVHAWDAFKSRDPTESYYPYYGESSHSRPDRIRVRHSNEKSIATAVYNRIALDVASLKILHVRTNEDLMYEETINSGLNYCLTQEANLDQSHKAFIQDLVFSMFDEGVIAVVPVETTINPITFGSYDILQLRVGKIVEWFPAHVRIKLYNEKIGHHQEITLPKKMVAIIENPFYAVMNEHNSTLQRLIRKLNILDAIDEQSGSGKLDILIQLPYVIKTPQRKKQAEDRRKDIEVQLSGSTYGIAYIDGTEKVTQLNRPAENNLMKQIEYLTNMFYSQLGITEAVFNGTADEAEMLNYNNRSVNPVVSVVIAEFKRKFLTRTARTQLQSIMSFSNAFAMVPIKDLADAADKFTRNEILTSNEVRSEIGYKPSKDPKANELRNKNLNAPEEEPPAEPPKVPEAKNRKEIKNNGKS